MANAVEPLEHELKTYRAKLPEMAEHEGKYALIKGDNIAGIYDTFGDALSIGYDKFGLSGFLVQKIAATEVPLFLSRYGVPA
jgi:hypothetical protein